MVDHRARGATVPALQHHAEAVDGRSIVCRWPLGLQSLPVHNRLCAAVSAGPWRVLAPEAATKDRPAIDRPTPSLTFSSPAFAARFDLSPFWGQASRLS